MTKYIIKKKKLNLQAAATKKQNKKSLKGKYYRRLTIIKCMSIYVFFRFP